MKTPYDIITVIYKLALIFGAITIISLMIGVPVNYYFNTPIMFVVAFISQGLSVLLAITMAIKAVID
jgi:hypothetical protein